MQRKKKSTSSITERRTHDRIRRNLKIRFGAFWDLSQESWDNEGDIIDFGGGGVKFVTLDSVEKGTQLILLIEFPGWISDAEEWAESQDTANVGVLKVIGEVLRVEPRGPDSKESEVAVRFSGRIRL